MSDVALKPELDQVGIQGNAGDFFVFLQKFPELNWWPTLYDTEILVCPRSEFTAEDQSTLDTQIASMTDFAQIDEAWWTSKTAACIELGYYYINCDSECCGVGKKSMPLNKRQAVHGDWHVNDPDVSQKSVFIYGTGAFDGTTAFHHTCDHKCWSNWSGNEYYPGFHPWIPNNSNTFTSTVLSCVYGLSQKKPNLGMSDMVTVSCQCAASVSAVII